MKNSQTFFFVLRGSLLARFGQADVSDSVGISNFVKLNFSQRFQFFKNAVQAPANLI